VALTIDELAAASGTTSRTIRSFQSLGLVDPPQLRGRTGLYGPRHLDRLQAVLRLQGQGFSLQSLQVLLDAHDRGRTLGEVLGLPGGIHRRSEGAGDVPDATVSTTATAADTSDSAELYGFSELQARGRPRRGSGRDRPLLAVVPTTVWDQTAWGETEAS
jgi:DNA-binding transcriptional MerR regulator